MNPDEPTEAELTKLAVAGDECALTALLQRYAADTRQRIAATIGAKWQSIIDADDVMQITFLEAFLTIHRFVPRGNGAFSAWLARIAQNNLRDAIEELSRQKRPHPDRRIVAADESAVLLLDKIGCTTTTPSRHLGRRELAQTVLNAVEQLPDDYARVIRLYDIEGRAVSDVAAEIGRSEGAVYMLRARAHDRLRESFAQHSGIFG